jgi:hypothetical protein
MPSHGLWPLGPLAALPSFLQGGVLLALSEVEPTSCNLATMVTKMVTNSATPSIIKCYGVTSEVEIPQTNASINLVLNEVCEFKLQPPI